MQVRIRRWVDGSEGRLDGGLRHRLVGQSGHRRRLPPRQVALVGRQKTNGWGSISILLKSEMNGEQTQFNSISKFVKKICWNYFDQLYVSDGWFHFPSHFCHVSGGSLSSVLSPKAGRILGDLWHKPGYLSL